MIKVYATTLNGNGYVAQIGEYESMDDIEIRTGMFAKDVVISFYEEPLEQKD